MESQPKITKYSRLINTQGRNRTLYGNNEVSFYLTFNHPQILRISNIRLDGSGISFSMPQIPEVQEKVLSKDGFFQLLDVLAYLNSGGLIHGDLWIDNYIEDYEGKIWLIDFETVRLAKSEHDFIHERMTCAQMYLVSLFPDYTISYPQALPGETQEEIDRGLYQNIQEDLLRLVDDPELLSLLDGMFNPSSGWSLRDCQQHPYFADLLRAPLYLPPPVPRVVDGRSSPLPVKRRLEYHQAFRGLDKQELSQAIALFDLFCIYNRDLLEEGAHLCGEIAKAFANPDRPYTLSRSRIHPETLRNLYLKFVEQLDYNLYVETAAHLGGENGLYRKHHRWTRNR